MQKQIGGVIETLKYISLVVDTLLSISYSGTEHTGCKGFDQADEVLKRIYPDPTEYPLLTYNSR